MVGFRTRLPSKMVLISWTNHNFFLAASLLAAGPYPTNGPFHFGQAQKTFKIIIAYFHKKESQYYSICLKMLL